MTRERSYPLFADPSVFKDGRVQPHPFKRQDGEHPGPACKRCGAGPTGRMGGYHGQLIHPIKVKKGGRK